jgi:uncharacterized membrane protein YobD (UPF0266 family)
MINVDILFLGIIYIIIAMIYSCFMYSTHNSDTTLTIPRRWLILSSVIFWPIVLLSIIGFIIGENFCKLGKWLLGK